MYESNVPPKDYITMSASARIRSWKWWFILLLLASIVAGGGLILRELGTVMRASQGVQILSPILATAYAQADADTSKNPAKRLGDADMRAYIMIGILSLIAMVTLVCLCVSLFATNERGVQTASDLLKTCIGFFIGAASNYFGGAP